MLSGCAPSSGSGLVTPALPPLPGDLATACPAPVIRAGEDVRAWAARSVQAFAACRRRHGDTVTFYDDVRTRFGSR